MRMVCIFLLFLLLSLSWSFHLTVPQSLLYMVHIYCLFKLYMPIFSNYDVTQPAVLWHIFCLINCIGLWPVCTQNHLLCLSCSVPHSRVLTPALWHFDSNGNWEGRRKREARVFFLLSAFGNIADSGHIPSVALPPSGQTPMAPASDGWPWPLDSRNYLFPLSFQLTGGSSFHLLLFSLSFFPCLLEVVGWGAGGGAWGWGVGGEREREGWQGSNAIWDGLRMGWREWLAARPYMFSVWCWTPRATVKQLRCHRQLESTLNLSFWAPFFLEYGSPKLD